MGVALYTDVHVPQAVAEQLRRRQVDLLTAIEDAAAELSDDQLLNRANELRRVIVTFDIRFKAMAQSWQSSGQPFAGLIYAHPMRVSIGQLVQNLELIAKATEQDEWTGWVEHLPL